MDRLTTMRVFCRVVDSGSFAAAARESNLSPAGVTRLVADLEDMGVVELRTDPSDGRAKLVRFTPKGARGIEQGLAVTVYDLPVTEQRL